ncbi:hypothetical protein [Aegicerativicinus sediminis]|uniref:hypothetical protein n=1 Tax=Aegicerativicinus sediminis TaxID=2893202 RepID=UPI001E34DDDE|nr:hypothetical protein [Aegicerativicinus sediminis]
MIILALSQWILGPYIDYITPTTHWRYYMYVDENQYYAFVLPVVIVFILPIILLKKSIDINRLEEKLKGITSLNPKLPWILVGFGILCSLVGRFMPGALVFVFFLFSQFKYIGLIYMFFSETKYDNYLLYAIFGATILSSIQAGLFHDLILWSALFSTFIVYRYKWGLKRRFVLMGIGFLFVVTTQSIKAEFREIKENTPEVSSLDLYANLAINQISGEGLFSSEEQINDLNVRLNQGWIISAIIDNIPRFRPYIGGETIKDAVFASLLPRFLNPNKKQAGGRENFKLFTGMEIKGDTSMGISILGEAYGNYGPNGALIFMFIWGLLLVGIYNLVVLSSLKYPSVILWLPLIFLQVLKAETELLVVLNHLIKASLIVFLTIWFVTKSLKWKL